MSRVLLLGVLFMAACRGHKHGHDHASAHPEGHDHHAEGHGHGDVPVRSLTLWSDQFELFAEHPAAVVNHSVPFLLHVTDLNGFKAVESAELTLEFTGPASMQATTSEVVRSGIFKMELTPQTPGDYVGTLHVKSGPTGATGAIAGIKLRVLSNPNQIGDSKHDDDGLIQFLKEQQWRVPFATEFSTHGTVVATVEVAGRVATPPSGTAEVGAPVAGRVAEPAGGLLAPGTQVRKGQLLASLIPAPSSPEHASQAALAVAQAQARLSAADKALARATRLIQDEAISTRELEDAQREQRVARASVQAASRAAAMYRGGSRERWPLRAPKSGTLIEVRARPGASVQPGERLFQIIDTRQLWIVARVPEQDAARLRTDRSVAYRVTGLQAWKRLYLTGDTKNAAIVTVGKTVDRVTRTVEVIYAVQEPDPALRVGGLLELELPAGQDFEGVTVPRSALIEQQGRHAVYVQVDGEHFAERLVRTGPRSGNRVGIQAGLKVGERIVTQGAHLVRLADRASNTQAHGHIH